jgi:hypothetical protein
MNVNYLTFIYAFTFLFVLFVLVPCMWRCRGILKVFVVYMNLLLICFITFFFHLNTPSHFIFSYQWVKSNLKKKRREWKYTKHKVQVKLEKYARFFTFLSFISRRHLHSLLKKNITYKKEMRSIEIWRERTWKIHEELTHSFVCDFKHLSQHLS